jgi:hypothetical protein
MRDTLSLYFHADTDGTGELFAKVNAKGFSGASSAWFGIDQIVEFAQKLAGSYPLQAENPVSLEGGFWSKSGAVVEQLHLGLKFYPVGSIGLVGCRVSLTTSIHPHERLESQSLVAVELTVHYEQLRSFARSVEDLANGGVSEAFLETEI